MVSACDLLVKLSFAATAATQFVAPPTGFTTVTGYAGIPVRYKQVPSGICELDPRVKSFSGYADIAKDQHSFFWFFEAREVDPLHAPLTVWINGGPGSSSMIGLFEELGPCRVDYFGNVFDNPHSWSRASNMLFIDQPTQVGFSYSVPVPGTIDPDSGEITVLPNNTCRNGADSGCGTWSLPFANMTANSTANAAPNMWKTLQGFMGAFPQYSRNEFHFATESYGGHYAPIFNNYILKQNSNGTPGTKKINLRSVLIGNGWVDPVTQYEAFYNFTVSPGNTYDLDFYNASLQQQLYDNVYGRGKCIDGFRGCGSTGSKECAAANKFCAVHVESFLEAYTQRDVYDVREMNPDPFPYRFYHDYLNRADVQKAIGAFTNFSASNAAVYKAFSSTNDEGREVGAIKATRDLLTQGITVALFAGDADYSSNWLGCEKIADMVSAPGWHEAGYTDVAISDNKPHAQVKQIRNFSFTRFFDAGHEVPFYQPLASLEFFERVIGGKDIATGKVRITDECNYRTKGPARSTYRQGNSTVQRTVTPGSLTYDTQTNKPGAPWADNNSTGSMSLPSITRRFAKRYFKPGYVL